MGAQKKYWQSFGELYNTQKYQERVFKKEFAHRKEQLPVAEISDEGLEQNSISRRDFLKYLGFSSAVVALASSCQETVQKTIPLLNKPENVIPGDASYYATTFVSDGQVVPVVAKVRDGRPIKLAGNTLSSLHKGNTSAQVQASVLNLYDTARLRNALIKNKTTGKFEKINDIAATDKILNTELDLSKGKIALVTNSVNSPTSQSVINDFVKKYQADFIVYDSISYGGILSANKETYGLYAIPVYHFDKVEVLVSIGADFLGTWLDSLTYAVDWAKTRFIDAKNITLSKHYQFEALMSISGANADERFVVKPSDYALIVVGLYEVLQGKSLSYSLPEPIRKAVMKTAKNLLRYKKQALVICDSNDTNVQILVNAINELLQARENIIDWKRPSFIKKGNDEAMVRFVEKVKNRQYDIVIFANEANPVYEFALGRELAIALKKVRTVISLNNKMDETTELATYIFPDHYYLESWGDAELRKGTYTFLQPTINTLFKSRNWQTSLLAFMGADTTYEKKVKAYWVNKLGSQQKYDKALQDGIWNEAVNVSVKFEGKAVPVALEAIPKENNKNLEIVLYQKIAIGSGKMAHNPWLQEMPDPITRATWDNYVMISPVMAKNLGIVVDDTYEVEPEKPVVALTIEGQNLELPVLVIPGVHPEVVGVALGYGRSEKIGKAVVGVGKNVAHFAVYKKGTIRYSTTLSAIKKIDKTYPVAYTQTHNSYEGREEVLREFTLAEFKKNPNLLLEKRKEVYDRYGNGIDGEEAFCKSASLYPEKEETSGIRWGLSLDLNACFGCGACIISCNAENNISVVGKKQVMKSHEMHWLRIDRYFSGDPNNPEVVFQPMMCQQCNNAPCENVCPVGATMHSEEGLNHMAYNRCVGTRYCANNCPYKVRRFNWLDWNGADSFSDNQKPLVAEGSLDEVVLDMNEDLTRMVLNPDVTLRSRGVIEKCSFCIQRLQEAKIKAKKENRPVRDGDVTTACSEACPTDAIVFGNVFDKESKIHKLRSEKQKERVFYVLEQLHILPNVNYLAKIRNKEEEI